MSQDQLSTTFSALADPTRRAILARLALGETSVTELAAPFEMSLPAVSKHLKVLENAGLISRSKDAQWRPCKLEAGPLRDVAAFLENYRQFWEQSLDRLDDYLQALQKGDPGGPTNSPARSHATEQNRGTRKTVDGQATSATRGRSLRQARQGQDHLVRSPWELA